MLKMYNVVIITRPDMKYLLIFFKENALLSSLTFLLQLHDITAHLAPGFSAIRPLFKLIYLD